jgi:hypothetical protein
MKNILSTVKNANEETYPLSNSMACMLMAALIVTNSLGCMELNQPVLKALKVASPSIGNQLSRALSFPEDRYVCILEPYTNRVDTKHLFSTQINLYLSLVQFLGDEGHWTIVHGVTENWIAEKIKRKSMELQDLRNADGKKIDSMCGYAKNILFHKPLSDKVTFDLMEQK